MQAENVVVRVFGGPIFRLAQCARKELNAALYYAGALALLAAYRSACLVEKLLIGTARALGKGWMFEHGGGIAIARLSHCSGSDRVAQLASWKF